MQTWCSGKLYGIFVAKDLIMLDPSKTKMVYYSAMRRTSLVDGKSILKSLEPSHYYTTKHTQGTFGEENTITAAEVSLAVKTLKAKKAVGCDEIRPEMFKALTQEVLWLTHVCQVAWCSGRSLKISKLG